MSMRFPAVLALPWLLLPLLTGCLESKESFALAKDGSGRIEATYVTDLVQARALLQMGSMLMDPAQVEGVSVDANDPFHPAWFRAAAKGVEGFQIEKAERVLAADSRRTTLVASFRSLEAAAKGGAFFNASVVLERTRFVAPVAEGEGEDTQPPGGGEQGQPADEGVAAWRLVIRPLVAQEMNGMPVKDLLSGFREMLSGMRLERRVVLPSEVLWASEGASVEGQAVTQRLDFEGLLALESLALEIVFADVEGLSLEPFQVEPDLMALLPRFKDPAPSEEPVVTEGGAGEGTGDSPDGGAEEEDGDEHKDEGMGG